MKSQNHQNQTLEHGGNIGAAITQYGRAKEDWIDLSTGINPIPYPVSCIPDSAWHRLPDDEAMQSLLTRARQYYGVPENLAITAAPGTQAIIQRLPQLANGPAHVAVVTPTYAEHAHVWQSHGHTLTEIPTFSELPEDCTIAIVVNPNNPDGKLHTPEDLLAVSSKLRDRGGFLVVDEAFCDVTPKNTFIRHKPEDGVVILKSFGKFFGLAGMRLGFALGQPDMISALHRTIGPWAVPGPALHIGAIALADKTWVQNTRRSLSANRQRLEGLLASHGLGIVGATDLFVLTNHDRAPELCDHLGHVGILTRSFSRHPKWLRFGMVADDLQLERLDRAMNSFQADTENTKRP